MNSLVITVILTIFYTKIIHSNEHDDNCFKESQRQDIMQRNCMDAVFRPPDFIPKANETFVDYDEDDDAVRRFAHHYCPILDRVIKCLPIGLNVSEECRTPHIYESDLIRFRLLGVMLHWACDNDAEILIQILQDDGLKTFMFSNEFHQCGQILSDASIYDPNSITFVVNLEYCMALDRVLECYKDLVQTHKNRNLVRLAGDLHSRIRHMWNC